MGILDDISNWAGRERDRILNSNRRLIDPKERDKINKGDLTPYRDERPSMKQEDHPDHNMPKSEHNGVEIKANPGGQD